jgi:hypothetical protein
VKFKSQSYGQNFSLQFYLGKWNFILTRQILSRPAKAKFYFSKAIAFIYLALYTILYSSRSFKRSIALILLVFCTGRLVDLGKDQFRRSGQDYAAFPHFIRCRLAKFISAAELSAESRCLV